MLCSELMKRDVERCLETALVVDAAAAMRERGVGFLPITTADGVVVGTITDRDIVVRVLAEGRAPDRTRVSEVTTRELTSCRPEDDLAVVEELMSRHRRSRIVCTNTSGRIAGVISLSTIAKLATRGPAGTIAAAVAEREASEGPHLPRMRVRRTRCREIMRPAVESSRLDDGVRRIAELMRDRNVGFVPVCDERGAAVGTVTDRDLTLRVIAARRSAETTRAADIMSPEVISCSPEDPLGVAERLMTEYRKSRIVCVDDDLRPLGMISLSDIARVERTRRVSRVLREIASRPAQTSS
jgi:CBS domain-containing protein